MPWRRARYDLLAWFVFRWWFVVWLEHGGQRAGCMLEGGARDETIGELNPHHNPTKLPP